MSYLNKIYNSLTTTDLTAKQTFYGKLSSTPTDSDYSSGEVALYVKDDGKLYKRPNGGTETLVADGGSSYSLPEDIESGGSAEMSVQGLSGDLAATQDPKSHNNTAHSTNFASDSHDNTSHSTNFSPDSHDHSGETLGGTTALTSVNTEQMDSTDATVQNAPSSQNSVARQAELDTKLDENRSVTTQTASGTNGSYTTTDENVVLVDTATNGVAYTVTLASADAVTGNVITVGDSGGGVGTNPITIDTEGTETIDGQSSQTIGQNYAARSVMWSGSEWNTVNHESGFGASSEFVPLELYAIQDTYSTTSTTYTNVTSAKRRYALDTADYDLTNISDIYLNLSAVLDSSDVAVYARIASHPQTEITLPASSYNSESSSLQKVQVNGSAALHLQMKVESSTSNAGSMYTPHVRLWGRVA